MTLRDDLIAARALIDTEEKFARIHVIDALDQSLPDPATQSVEDRYAAMLDALRAQHGGNLIGLGREPHADVLALFDRAIAAASTEPVSP